MKRLHLAVGLFTSWLVSAGMPKPGSCGPTSLFDFQMGETVMAAGEYAMEYSAGLVNLPAADGNHVVMTLTPQRPCKNTNHGSVGIPPIRRCLLFLASMNSVLPEGVLGRWMQPRRGW